MAHVRNKAIEFAQHPSFRTGRFLWLVSIQGPREGTHESAFDSVNITPSFEWAGPNGHGPGHKHRAYDRGT